MGATSNKHNLFKSKRHSEDLSYSLYKGLEKLKNRELEEAIECFDKSIAVMPNTPDGYFHRGVAYFESDMTAKALKDFEKIAEEWPKYNKSTFLYLSMIYAKITDINSAITSVLYDY
jgi:tetratricopeptide (TPR) repeat protein